MSFCKLEAPYPLSKDSHRRVIFAVDPKGDQEKNFRVQLIPGRNISMSRSEAENIHLMGGSVECRNVEGWKAPYYEVELSEHVASTRMMMMTNGDDGSTRAPRFVPMIGGPMIAYDSKVPVVVDIPDDAELRYSLWSAENEQIAHVE